MTSPLLKPSIHVSCSWTVEYETGEVLRECLSCFSSVQLCSSAHDRIYVGRRSCVFAHGLLTALAVTRAAQGWWL